MRGTGDPARRRARLRDPRPAVDRLDLRELQRAARQGRRARRPRGARARAPGRGDRRRRLLRQGAGSARRPGRGRRRVRRRGRRAQHRLVGGLGGPGLVRAPLRRARRRRPAGLLVGVGRGAALRAHRRGRHARRLPARARAVDRTQRALRRVARRAARLRLRLLPAGPRGRPQGRQRRLPRDPQPCARAVQRPVGVDRGAHARRREVGRPDTGGRNGARDWRERALRAEAERDAARIVDHSNALRGKARIARAGARRSPRPRAASRGGSPHRCGGAAGDRLRQLDRRLGALPRLRGAGHRAGGGRRRRRARDTPPSARSRARTTCCWAPPRGTRTSRRSCWSTRTARSTTRGSPPQVRETLGDPEVAIAGCAGASGVASIAWWEGAVSRGPVVHRYEEHGGGDLPALEWAHPAPAPARVDMVDGVLFVLSPWAVRNAALRRAAAHARVRPRPLPAGARRRPRDLDDGRAGRPPPRARADRRHRPLGRGAHAGRGEVGRGADRRAHGRGRLARTGAAGRGGARGRARRRLLERARLGRARPPARTRDGAPDRHPRMAADGAAAARATRSRGACAAAASRARGGSRPCDRPPARRSPHRHGGAGLESRSAMPNALDSSSRRSTASWRSRRPWASHSSTWRACASAR